MHFAEDQVYLTYTDESISTPTYEEPKLSKPTLNIASAVSPTKNPSAYALGFLPPLQDSK